MKRTIYAHLYEEDKSPSKNDSDSNEEEVDEDHKKKFAEAWEWRRKEKSDQQAKWDVALSDNYYSILGLEDF